MKQKIAEKFAGRKLYVPYFSFTLIQKKDIPSDKHLASPWPFMTYTA
jgi:hypothetical protein